jgi:hypothetical protein
MTPEKIVPWFEEICPCSAAIQIGESLVEQDNALVVLEMSCFYGHFADHDLQQIQVNILACRVNFSTAIVTTLKEVTLSWWKFD